MRKWYVIIVAVLIGFILISTSCFAADIGLASDSKKSDEKAIEEDSSSDVDKPDSDDEANNNIIISNNDQQSQSFTGNEPPVADFYYEQDQNDKFTFYFYDNSSDPDGEIIFWKWSFNDGTGSVSYLQDPKYNFEHVAGRDITVLLIVGDNGVPQEFASKSRIINIPKNDSNNELESYSTIFYSNQLPIKSNFLIMKSSLDNNYQYLLNKMTDTIRVLSKISNVFISRLSREAYSSLLGGDCNLYFQVVTYFPDPPKCNRYLTFYCDVGDRLNNYYGSITIQILIDKLNIQSSFTVTYGQTNEISIFWPDGATGNYQIALTIYPEQYQGWNEIDWPDNTITLSVSVSLSVQEELIINSLTSSNLINSNTEEEITSVSKTSVSGSILI